MSGPSDQAHRAGSGHDDNQSSGVELLHTAIERQAVCAPDRVAVRLGERALSYGQLNRQAALLARELQAQGVGPGRVVGVCAERSLELIIVLLGILRAGAAYLPLDPSYPRRRLLELLEDAGPAVLLADAQARESIEAGTVVRSLDLERMARLAPRPSAMPPGGLVRAHPDDLAYVIYTSGSTGRPKGVMSTHRGIVNRLRWMQETYCLTRADRVLHKTSIGFDVSVWELFWPLMAGAQLVLANPGEQRDPEALGETMRTMGVTIAHFVPAMLTAFMLAGQLDRIGTLRAVMSSGEALPAGVRDQFFLRSKAALHNLYGPTEASIDVTHHTCQRGDHSLAVPIGRAIKGVQIHILDEHFRQVEPGCEGEIFISGVALARGYLGRPQLTAESFVPNPFGDGTRIYRTGDRGRLLPGGEVEFLGRRDGQVKIRGVRIELSEVESVLASLPGVERGVVMVASNGASPQLIGYVTGDCAPSERLRGELSGRLPEQAVPTVLVHVDAIPTLANGKTDRKALAALRLSSPDVDADNAGPAADGLASTAEMTLARIWREVLGVIEIEPGDNFFTLGGDSIRSIEVVARARSAGMQLTTSDVFAHPTLRDLARKGKATSVVDGAGPARDAFALIESSDRRLMPAGVIDAMPLSSLMSGLVAESLENPQYLVYTTTLSIEGPCERGTLDAALSAIVERHPVLRSTIDISRFSEPLQLIDRGLAISVEEIDGRGMSSEAWRESFDNWIAGERRTRFNWCRPPLVRFTIHRRDENRWQLTMSEPFLDGWSATLVLSELLTAYRGRLDGEVIELPPPPRVSNRDLVVDERVASRSAEHCVFWRKQLAKAPSTSLPRFADAGRGLASQSRESVPISDDVSRGLLRLASELDIPLKSILMAAHARTIAALTGQSEVVCGLMVNGRSEEPDGERAIGLFLNTLPMRLRVDGGSWADLARATYAAEAEILPWRRYPYARILHDHGGRSLFDSVFNFTHFRPYAAFGSDSAVRLRSVEGSDQTYFPLTAQFSLDPSGARVQLVLELNAGAFAPLQVEQLVDLHARALTAMAHRDGARHSDESLIGPRERSLRTTWPATRPPSLDGVSRLEGLFDQRVRASPEAVAVFNAHERLTFGQVQTGANQLAQGIQDRCGGAPKRVGICMERSPALLEAILAVLKLGAAFVPLDLEMPPRRLEALIGDAALDLVIADAKGGLAISGPVAEDQSEKIVRIDGRPRPGEGLAPDAAAPGASADSPAQVIYTSGSTGLPKGVISSHRAIVNRLRWMWGAYPFEAGEVNCVRGSLSFVDSITSLFGGVLRGVPTYVLPDDVREPDAIARALGDAGVTRLTLVPAILQELLRECGTDRRALLGGIKHWVLSGEPLSGELVNRLLRVAPGATVLNLYGSTEVAGDVTAYECGSQKLGTVPAGAAIDGMRVRVVDHWGRDLPCGAVGEVTVEGPGLAVGYLGDARLTADRFRPSPAGEGKRVFRTGDLGRHRPDGALEICGRADRQVKVNGVRVEPAEIESELASHPLVGACAVVLSRVRGGESSELVAFVEPSGAIGTDENRAISRKLRGFLRAQLPSPMVPGRVVIEAALPRTPSGKIDRSGLTARATECGERVERVLPSTPLERVIARVWAEELGVEAIGVEDDFFELGGDSLTAVRVLARLRQQLEVKLTLRDLFDHPNVGDLSQRTEGRALRGA